ncbi:alpha-1,2-mannosidase [Ktedonobacter sp. SOSP1-52]|uniref:GH92 family glycosyl hydrolase n=1 Tax=Ktedonobacter sp. SOSP1-52 TaxID=2778366 RepID=UPI001915DF9D|nr:lectin [Ktedonobacter sp. SOSP1-52]GHO61671.1 alpha-1,2-mannosidase [Ktedonobacter sp. SOSP1-52]
MMRVRSNRFPLTISMVVIVILLAEALFLPAVSAKAASTNVERSYYSSSSTTDLAKYVNPFTGTGVQPGAPYGGGDTFPGADVPFGMVQWSPDTAIYNSGGYWYPDNRIKGFSLTHLNGAGCSTYSDIPFMPYVGTVTTSPASNPSQYYSTFSHANETAYAGYYRVKLDNGVTTELTATQRSGAGRFTYPQGQPATMLVNVSGSINGVNDAQVDIGKDTISGWATSGYFCGANDVYRVYFWAKFSQSFASIGTWHDAIVTPGASTSTGGRTPVAPAVRKVHDAQAQVKNGQKVPPSVMKSAQAHPDTTVSGPGSGAFVTFNTSANNAISVKVGLSFVSVSNAQANVNQENKTGNFTTISQQSDQTWNSWLGRLKAGGGTSTQLTTFYSALYHVYLQPNVFSDVNGQYIGFDGRIHSVAKGHAQYANYSGWDIYRSEAQLLAFLAPKEASDIAQSMVNEYTQSGQLPKWTAANGETYVMVGDPADAIIADIYAFGGKNFDTKTALSAMIKEATQTNNVRPDLNYLQSLGYVPLNGNNSCCNFYGPASTTLEYNTADFSIGAFAQALGDNANYQKFVSRAQGWTNLYNPADGYLEPRLLDGSFPGSYDPTSGTGWVEGDGAQYNWMVPFNLRGLFDALGGNATVQQRLDTFFTQLNGGPNSPYSFLGNEPTIETPWEYDYAGAPYKTQKVVRDIENTLWYPGPQGIAGNDDLGTMSAWYVWAALGMFPETPGTANLVLASPLFPSMTVSRESGQTIQITAQGASADTYYVQSLKVNGQVSTKPWLAPDFITKSGTLDYTMSSMPNPSWGSNANDAPPSYQYGEVGTFVSFKPGRAVVTPGGNTQISILGQNVDGNGTTISWSAAAPSGLSVLPASDSFAVPGRGSGSQSFTVAASSSLAEGYYSITFSTQTGNGQKLPSISLPVVVAKPGSLLPYFNNIGIGDDSNPGSADYDGVGYSYSAQQLAQAGFNPGATVSVNGTSYTWPNVSAGSYDNIEVHGQTLQLPGTKAGASQLAFLGSATNGDTQGIVTITYTDGSTQTAQLGFSDWTLGAGSEPIAFNNVIAAKMSYRDSGGSPDQTTTYLFGSAPISLDTSKTVASVTLTGPNNQGALHVFALAIS